MFRPRRARPPGNVFFLKFRRQGRHTRRHLQAGTRWEKRLDRPSLAQVCRLEPTSVRNGNATVGVQVATTSVAHEPSDAAKLLAYWRGHWHIEDWLHWIRDVVDGENNCRVRGGHGPQNRAALRNAAINLLRLSGCRQITPNVRRFAPQPRKPWRFLRNLKN